MATTLTSPFDRAEIARRWAARADSAAEEAQRCEGSLREFVRAAWPMIEPSPMVGGWHVDAVCEHLAAVSRGQIKKLVINIPPRSSKSLIVSVLWPAWEWVSDPTMTWMFMSYASDLSIRDSVKCRRLIQSPWYRQRWGARYRLMGDQNAKERYETDKGGVRMASSVGGGSTGFGGNRLVFDDPNRADEVESDKVRQGILDWYDGTMSTRKDDPRRGARVIVMQRLHEEDLTGHVLKSGGWTHLCLPMRFEPDRRCVTYIGGKQFFEDPRQEFGELLCPDRFSDQDVEEIETSLGSYGVSGQLQQRPSPAEGGIIKKHWWNYWQPAGINLGPVRVQMPNGMIEERQPITLPDRFDEMAQSWDMAFKGNQDSDYVAGLVGAAKGADRFILDAEHGRFDFPETLNAVRRLSMRNPRAVTKLVESKANGPAVVASLRHEIGGFVEVEPDGGKVARASAASPMVESGNWYLPHPRYAEWVGDPSAASTTGFLGELANFPMAKHDDYVDAFSQLAGRLQNVQPAADEVDEEELLQRSARGYRGGGGWAAA